MDLMLRNEEERAQALRVVRRVIGVVGAGQSRRHRAAYIDHGLLRCLVAVARAGSAGDGTGDRLARPAIATLAEICKDNTISTDYNVYNIDHNLLVKRYI